MLTWAMVFYLLKRSEKSDYDPLAFFIPAMMFDLMIIAGLSAMFGV